MVQIIPAAQRNPSFAEKLNASIGAALETGSRFVNEYQNMKSQENQRKEQSKILKELTGQDLSQLSPELQKTALAEMLKGKNKEKQQQFLNTILNKNEKSPTDLQFAQPKQTQQLLEVEELGNQSFPYSHEQIVAASMIDPNVAREMRSQNESIAKEQRENITAKQRNKEALRKETFDYKKQISEKADAARHGIQNKEHLLDLIENGDIDDPSFATIAEAIPLGLGKRLLSNDTVEYKSGLIEEFGDLKNLFPGQVRVKEIELLEQKIADLYLTDEQKKAILKSRINAIQADVIREEVASEMEEEGLDLSLLKYKKELNRRMEPKLKSLFNKILDEQNSVIKNAENRKKIPLNPNDPEDMEIANQIMQEAGGDRNKARQLAKKKGYTF